MRGLGRTRPWTMGTILRIVVTLIASTLLLTLAACGTPGREDVTAPAAAAPDGIATASPSPIPPTPMARIPLWTPAPAPTPRPTFSPIVQLRDKDYVEIVADEHYNAFPGLARLADGTFIVVYRKGTLHYTDRGTVVMRTSSDMGKTWSAESAVTQHPKLDVRDPNIAALRDGTLIVSFFEYDGDKRTTVLNGVKVVRSRDNGASWGPPIEVPTESLAATSAPVIELPDGDLLLAYYGNVKGASHASAWAIRSADGGETWGDQVVIGDGTGHGKPYQEPNLVVLDNGHILATIRSDGTSKIIHTSVSRDSGATWSPPMARFKGSGTPSVLQLASGTIVTIYRSKLGRHFGWPALRTSEDGGETWTSGESEFVIDRVGGPMMYASALEPTDGMIAVAYGMEDGPSRSEIRFRYIVPLGE